MDFLAEVEKTDFEPGQPLNNSADASLAAAEVLNVSRIFTTDTNLYVYRRHGNQPFEVLPFQPPH